MLPLLHPTVRRLAWENPDCLSRAENFSAVHEFLREAWMPALVGIMKVPFRAVKTMSENSKRTDWIIGLSEMSVLMLTKSH
jgi:hypothetical protein